METHGTSLTKKKDKRSERREKEEEGKKSPNSNGNGFVSVKYSVSFDRN